MEQKATESNVKKEQELKTCPKCKKTFTGAGALSRRDNKTEICSECGTAEALEDFSNYLEEENK